MRTNDRRLVRRSPLSRDQLTDHSEPKVPFVHTLIVVKVDVGSVSHEQIAGYMDEVRKRVIDDGMHDQGFRFFFLPIKDGPTTLTAIELTKGFSATA